jgi:hypothetical protein
MIGREESATTTPRIETATRRELRLASTVLKGSRGSTSEVVDTLTFSAIQTYSSGEEVAWIETAGGGAEPEHPAPTVQLVAADRQRRHHRTAPMGRATPWRSWR